MFSTVTHPVRPKTILYGSSPPHFWHQRPVLWKITFPRLQGGIGERRKRGMRGPGEWWGWEWDGFGMTQTYHIYCELYFYYYYINSISDHHALDPEAGNPALGCARTETVWMQLQCTPSLILYTHRVLDASEFI